MSPGKTWEGFVAGFVASVLVAFFALYQDRHEFLKIWEALVLGAVLAIAGTIGDLFESAVKRDMQVKDTGRLLGGHGGVLDRIDSLLFASVAGLLHDRGAAGMTRVALLGATGSIGRQAIEIIEANPGLELVAAASGSDADRRPRAADAGRR